jgi:hypothetical protein
MLTSQLSYSGEKNCCPELTTIEHVQMLNSKDEIQLDQLQAESILMDVKLPSLERSLALKMPPKKSMLEQMHTESGLLNQEWSTALPIQLEAQLKSRIMNNHKGVTASTQ